MIGKLNESVKTNTQSRTTEIACLAAFLSIIVDPSIAQTNNPRYANNSKGTWETPILFANATADIDSPAGKLLKEQPNALKTSDLEFPFSFAKDLSEHRDAISLFVWEHLSESTRLALTKHFAEVRAVRVSIAVLSDVELEGLTKDLNTMIDGESIYNEERFKGKEISGDTLQLINSNPSAKQLKRMNRLLLEDAFPLDIARSPKIVTNVNSGEFVMVRFKPPTLSLYDESGKQEWMTEIVELTEVKKDMQFRRIPGRASDNNLGLWDVRFSQSNLFVKVVHNWYFAVELETGRVHVLQNR